MSDNAAIYAEYESALVALSSIPPALRHALSAADAERTAAVRATEKAAEEETTRLASLRRTSQARYEAVVEKLRAQGMPTPAQVRPVTTSGSAGALRESIAALASAVAVVEAEIRREASAAQRSKEDGLRQAAAAREAAAALRTRQAKLKREREAVDEARRAAEEAEAASTRRRILTLLFGGGSLLLAIVIIVVAISQ